MSVPSRNATGKAAPGQIVNTEELDKLAYYGNPPRVRARTLEDVIDRVQRQEAQREYEKKKLTFEEWLNTSFVLNRLNGNFRKDSLTNIEALKLCWNAAQENK
jgi:hypothetical protein